MTEVVTNPRRRLDRRARLKLWEQHKGICVICQAKIDGVRDKWIIEHIRALELGGSNDDANLGPAHEACAKKKTKQDHSMTAKAKRRKIKHLGIKKPGSFQTNRDGPFKKRMDGTVVRR